MLPWEHVVDVEMYNTNKTQFAYCNPDGCAKVNDSRNSVFWNRLRIKQGSLLLTGIEESDDGLEFRVTVHLNSDDTKVKSKRAVGMQTVRVYVMKILVVMNSSQGNCCHS